MSATMAFPQPLSFPARWLTVGIGALTVTAVVVASVDTTTAHRSATDTASSAETLTALTSTDVLKDSAMIRTVSDSDSAAISTVHGATVDIPRDSGGAVTFSQANGSQLLITPPHVGNADARSVAPGVVAYSGADGGSTAVQATDNGGVRMLTVIDDAAAPDTYTYDIDVPGGGKVIVNADGTAAVVDAGGTAVATVQEPWATDAKGVAVPTYYTTDGSTLTQHVAHRSGTFAYPVTADPWFWSYLGCILGTGVPAGVAVFFATAIGTVAAFQALWAQRLYIPSGGPAYSALLWYAGRVYNACRNFINS